MNENEIRRMQQDAVRRAQEMQNRARNENRQNKSAQEGQKQNTSEEPNNNSENKQSCNTQKGHSSESTNRQDNMVSNTKNPVGGIFDILMKDKERTLILCLVLLIMDEKSDNSLLLALLYLLI